MSDMRDVVYRAWYENNVSCQIWEMLYLWPDIGHDMKTAYHVRYVRCILGLM